MKYSNGIISVILLLMLVIQPLIMLHPATAEANTSHVIVKAVMSDKQTVLHIDSKLYGKNAKKYTLHNNLAGIGRSYNLDIFFNSTEFHLDGTIQFSKNITSVPHIPQTSVPPRQNMGIGSIGNLTASIEVHIKYTPESNMTHIDYQGKAEFDVKSNQTGGHYVIDFHGKRVRNLTMVVDNANLIISHTFEMTSVGPTSGMGGTGGSSTGTTVTAHTYVDIARSTIIAENTGSTHTHVKIITDDSADWMLIQGLALIMQYQGANVTMPPIGQLPIVGQKNVTVIIDMSKSAQVNMQLINVTKLSIINETRLGPFTADATINITEGSTGYMANIKADGTGDFSTGMISPPYGIAITYLNIHAEGSKVKGSERQVLVGDVKLKQEDPGVVFLGIKHAMMQSYVKAGHNAVVNYTFQSDSSDIKFLLDNNEYTHITFTTENATKLPELKLEYNGTVISGANGLLEFVILKHLPKATVTIPLTENTSKVVVRAAESDSLLIHPKGGIHAAKEVMVNITIAGNHQILIQLTPGTDLTSDINVTVMKTPGEMTGIPKGYKPAGLAYKVNAYIKGKVILGIKVDKGDLNSVVVLWIHGTGANISKGILHPFKIDEHARMVYVTVPGFSTFIPIIPTTATTTQTTGTSSGTSTHTTSTNSGTQTISTSTTSLHSHTTTSGISTTQTTSSTASSGTTAGTGAKSNTGVIAGVIIVIVILAFAGYYLARR